MFNFEKISKELDTQYFYHIKPNENIKELIPLSILEKENKSAYNKAIKKYEGREGHLNKKIKLLDATWKDCINFSTINPILLFDLAKLLNLKNNKYNIGKKVLKFPISALEDKKIVLYNDEKETYSKLNINKYKELKEIPKKTIDYYIKCMKNNEDPLAFAYIPHILCLDPIKISKAKEIIY